MTRALILFLLLSTVAIAASDLHYVVVYDNEKNEYQGWWDNDISVLHMKNNTRRWYRDRSTVLKVDPANPPPDEPAPAHRGFARAVVQYVEAWAENGHFLGEGWLISGGDSYILIKPELDPFNVGMSHGLSKLKLKLATPKVQPPKDLDEKITGFSIGLWLPVEAK